MEYIPNLVFICVLGAVVWLFHKGIGKYPKPLNRSASKIKELREIVILWLLGILIPVLRIFLIIPWMENVWKDRAVRELIQLPFLTFIYLLIPIYIVFKFNNWRFSDLGLRIKTNSKQVAIGAILFGVITGLTAFLTNETVVGIEVFPASVFILLLYNNDFLEEFFHRGIILAKLERVLDQKIAILTGGILFGLTHLPFDIVILGNKGVFFVISALVLQIMAGWLLGIIYIKTRSLWPGVVCHYLSNWLPAIFQGIFN